MKIQNSLPSQIQAQQQVDRARSEKSDTMMRPQPQIEKDGAARVSVSQRALESAKAKELATPDMSIDEAKVARLQSLIDSGNYKVDADALAERILSEHSTMIE